MNPLFSLRALFAALAICLLATGAGFAQEQGSDERASGELVSEDSAEAQENQLHIPKPDFQDIELIRFVTDNDYPPFNYLDEEGELTGFNVDLMRVICDELSVECSIRAVSWSRLLPSLEEGEADAVIASIRISEQSLKEVDFTDSYYHTPARFLALKSNPTKAITPETISGKKVGVLGGTAHEVYLGDFFTQSAVVAYASMDEAKSALRKGSIDFLFGDGVSLMFWLNGTLSEGCCEFRGGPFTESRYFGEGIGIAVRKGNRKMRDVLNYGLNLVRSEGRFEELYLRYFPLSFF